VRNPNLSIHPVQLARYLFFVAASLLLIFSIGTLLRIYQNPDHRVMYLVYATLFLGDAALMFICGLFVGKQKRVYWFAVVLLSLNIVLTITDQFGIIDFLFLWFNLIILGILIFARKSFLPHETNS
jgi:lysylphosphatidylglycerol synthetase-like protein (DUF2156 family)